MHAQKRNHVVLVNAITRDANATDQGIASKNGHTTREYLDAIGQLSRPALHLKEIVGIEPCVTRASFAYIRHSPIERHVSHVLNQAVIDEVELKPHGENTPFAAGF